MLLVGSQLVGMACAIVFLNRCTDSECSWETNIHVASLSDRAFQKLTSWTEKIAQMQPWLHFYYSFKYSSDSLKGSPPQFHSSVQTHTSTKFKSQSTIVSLTTPLLQSGYAYADYDQYVDSVSVVDFEICFLYWRTTGSLRHGRESFRSIRSVEHAHSEFQRTQQAKP